MALSKFFNAVSLGLGGAKREDYKLVLIGETGSGKTSFMNLLLNLDKIVGRDFEQMKFRDYESLSARNPNMKIMQSQTIQATTYKIAIPGDKFNRSICVIDTPGFGDSRGMNVDRRNAELIVDRLEQEKHIHCLCIVINGTMSRETTAFKYIMGELTTILPKDCINNIILVFTNVRDEFSMNFHSDVLFKYIGKKIPDGNIFCIDNPICRLQKMLDSKKSVSNKSNATRALRRDFEEAVIFFGDLFKEALKFKVMSTTVFKMLYKMKQEVQLTSMRLVSELDILDSKKRELLKAEEDIRYFALKVNLKRDFKISKTLNVRTPEKQATHSTICSVPGCKKNCHSPCKMERTLDKEAFKKCCAFYWTRKEVRFMDRSDLTTVRNSLEQVNHGHLSDEDNYGSGVVTMEKLKVTKHFTINGVTVRMGGLVVGMTTWSEFDNLTVPCSIIFDDESDQGTCNVCGHSYLKHYHGDTRWVDKVEKQEIICTEMEKEYREAKTMKEKKLVMKRSIMNQQKDLDISIEKVKKKLRENITKLDSAALSRPLIGVLRDQKMFYEMTIQAKIQDNEVQGDALCGTVQELRKVVKNIDTIIRGCMVAR